MARPVTGAHFAFLTLGKACGGKAMEGLAFLEKREKIKGVDPRDQVILTLGAGEL